MVQVNKRKRVSTQGVLPMHGHGGRRVGAGRPRVPGSGVSHVRRPSLASRHPVHVTARIGEGLGSLRRRDMFKLVQQAVVDGASRPGFRVVEFSVQSNHIHMLCEGKDRVQLTRGLQGLFIRIARSINRKLERRGRVFADRYHDRVLKTPSEVRHALVYVLQNAKHHRGNGAVGAWWLDSRSSAPQFFGLQGSTEVARPHTWLLKVGWRRAGPISLDTKPKISGRSRSG